MNNICKYLLVPILLMGVAAEMSARRISEDEAYGKAARFMGAGRMELTRAVPPMSRAGVEGGCYVFNREGGGFVIVSGSDKTDEILAYGNEGSFNVSDIPGNVSDFLDGYNEQIEFVESNDITVKSILSRSNDDNYRDSITPMLTTRWAQHYPYNILCPIQNDNRTLAGCVATALAQVLAYHKHTYQPTGVYTATVKDQELSIMLDTCVINYSDIHPEYYGDETEEEMYNIALLMKMCGNLVNMEYGVNESTAFTQNIVNALTYLDYSDEAKYILRTDYKSQDEWEDIIYNNLKEYGPVIYRAKRSLYSGHCFVCDGYKDGYYHIDWGWSGMWNGYYKLTALKPAENYNFSILGYDFVPSLAHGAVINIRPNPSAETGLKDVTADIDGDIAIYDLFGRRVFAGDASETPALRSGIYIVRSGQSVRKIRVR